MCELCTKIDVMKELVTGYFTDEELHEVNRLADMPGVWPPEVTRLSIAIMAIAELCVDTGFPMEGLTSMIQVCYTRAIFRKLMPHRRKTE